DHNVTELLTTELALQQAKLRVFALPELTSIRRCQHLSSTDSQSTDAWLCPLLGLTLARLRDCPVHEILFERSYHAWLLPLFGGGFDRTREPNGGCVRETISADITGEPRAAP